ncbi:hypothetical protein [Inquilinus sp.]|jgi:hypothetical protein|uniref:hypothetical protein n=1 Tax=Inquilinus sp. TaxID=1932117 RepID=UPI00378309A8
MTEDQLQLLGRLTKDELLIAITTLVPFVDDRRVGSAVLDALDARTTRLRAAWQEARAASNAAHDAWRARPVSNRLRAEYHTASSAADRAFDATERAHREWQRAFAFGHAPTEGEPT